MLTEKEITLIIADACLEEKAQDILILDVGALTIIADYFVIASGRNAIQVKSIAEHIERKMKEAGIEPLRQEGLQQGSWVVLDYGGVIIHIFRQEERDYYDLEHLWADAQEIRVED